MDAVSVNVALDDDALAEPDRSLDRLRGAGLQVVRFRRVVGVVTGAVEPARVDELRAVVGVRSVEVDRQVRPL